MMSTFVLKREYELGALTGLPNIFSLGGIIASLVDVSDGKLYGKRSW